MEVKEVIVEVQGMEDGGDIHESRPQNPEITVEVLEVEE